MTKTIEYRLQGIERAIQEVVSDLLVEDDEVVQALVGDLERHDPRATYVDDTFQVTNVEFTDNGTLQISYSFEWGAHYGCSDMCKADIEHSTVVGRVQGGDLVLEVTEYEKRTTVEEF
jgi:hypothetical protein